ncbi:MAG: methyltransferase [Myxococcales bacterium]|nr:methyltransferase [Myxococcales bacterium]
MSSEDETLDPLIGDWSIFQLSRGHRFSTDDLVTAWRGSLARPDARTLLDIGCGVGSVGLCTLSRVSDPQATLVGIEAQPLSVALMQRTIEHNGLSERVRLIPGDLRDPTVLPDEARFDLITGSPPYIPVGKGVISPHPQRASARMELRGSVFDYCEAARRWLAPGGRFCFVMLAADPRTEEAPLEAGLAVEERWDVVFGANRAPHIATLVCGHADEISAPRRSGRLVIRGPDGEWTDSYMAFRREMGAR